MNSDLAYELSKEVLRLKEESNGYLTVNQALEIIVRQYKESIKLEDKNNNSLHHKYTTFKIGDKFKVVANSIIATIVEIDNNFVCFSQYSKEYGYYPNKTIQITLLRDLLDRKKLIRVGD